MYLLTPWSRVLLEKLIVTQLHKNSTLCSPKVHYRVHKSPPLVAILSHVNAVHKFLPHYSKLHLIYTLVSYLHVFQPKCCINFSSFPCVLYALPIPSSLVSIPPATNIIPPNEMKCSVISPNVVKVKYQAHKKCRLDQKLVS